MGSLSAFEAGEAITYGLYNAQERGTLFIGPGEKVYSGMVIGQTGRKVSSGSNPYGHGSSCHPWQLEPVANVLFAPP